MILEDTGLSGKQLTLEDMDEAMSAAGFVRWAWDYNRATYDYRYVDRKIRENYYLRIPVVAISGEIDEFSNDSLIEVDHPYLGRHTHPHGLEYEFQFPNHVLEEASRRLNKAKTEIERVENGQ